MMRSWWVIGLAYLAIGALLAVIGCRAAGWMSDNRVRQEPKISVDQNTGDGGRATSIVFQFVEGNAGGLAGGLGIVVIWLLMRRARLNAQIVERLVLAIEKADDGTVKQAVRDAGSWNRSDPIHKSLGKVVSRTCGGVRASKK